MQERVRGIRNTRKPSPKPTLEECVAILDEAASLPRPEEAPGGMYHLLSLMFLIVPQFFPEIFCARSFRSYSFFHSNAATAKVQTVVWVQMLNTMFRAAVRDRALCAVP